MIANYLAGTPQNLFSNAHDGILRRVLGVTVPNTISIFFFDTETAREYIDYLTERSDKLPCGRVKEGVAVSQGHGTTTTDHRTDGVSLATPASGLQRNPAFVKPTNPTKTCRHPHRRGSRGQWASSEGVGQTTRDVERTSALTNHSG